MRLIGDHRLFLVIDDIVQTSFQSVKLGFHAVEMLSAGVGDMIVLSGSAFSHEDGSFLDIAAANHAVHNGVERAVLDDDLAAAALSDLLEKFVAVHIAVFEHLQDDDVDNSAYKVFLNLHFYPPVC